MRITVALLFAVVVAAASAQEFGARIGKLSRTGRVGQKNGYFYPEPSPPFTLPPQTTTTTRAPTTTTRRTVAPVVEEKPTQPPVDYLPPTTTTTRRSYVQCSGGATCVASAAACANSNGQVSGSGECAAPGGQGGVCCRPIPTTTTTTTTTRRSYVQCSGGATCVASASACSSSNGQVSGSGECLAPGGQGGVCCRPIPTTTTTTTVRTTTVPVRTTQRTTTTARPVTTTPSLEYLPPTTTKGYDYPVPENPLVPGGSEDNPQVLRPTTTTTRRPVAPVVDEDEIAFWDFRESIPGEPEIDYPIFDKIPETAFSCSGKLDGFYADIEARCQVFHVCVSVPEADPIKNSFLCPNGTLFHQESFACQWWPDVECASSASFFQLNANIGVVPESASSSNTDVRISAGQTGISASASATSSTKVAAPGNTNAGRKY